MTGEREKGEKIKRYSYADNKQTKICLSAIMQLTQKSIIKLEKACQEIKKRASEQLESMKQSS